MKLFVIGFPKSGTTTLTVALRESGLNVAHWQVESGRFVGAMIYRGLLSRRDPFAELEQFDAVTQADVCLPGRNINLWPNLDFAVLRAIRRTHPECQLLLNYREPAKIAESMMRWPALQARLTRANIPGLPRGAGRTAEQLTLWIENHFDACRTFFASDPRFVEIDIASEEAPIALGNALGMTIKGWGVHRPSPVVAGALAGEEPSEL